MTTNIGKPEILAPCGSYEILKAAIHAGADACYVGGEKFGARAYAQNFDKASMLNAIDFAHIHNCKIYLTVNTLFKDNEISVLDDYISEYYTHGLDAVIVQDLGVFHHIKRCYPDLNIHCSTQMNITSFHGASLMKKKGASRVVVAREMSLEEIIYLKANTDIEVEAFVHGAMCYSYSGQCLLSSLAGGRSGNRGRCAQPCRKIYNGEYLLSMKDMCSLKYIPELVDAGIDSFKIEGRMKNAYYVASAVDAYNTLVNDYMSGCFRYDKAEEYKYKLASIYNRGGFTDGYFFMHNGEEMISKNRPNNQGVCIGKLAEVRNGTVKIELFKELYKQDVLEVKLSDNSTMDITSGVCGKPGMTVLLNAPKTRQIKQGQNVYRTRCNYFINEIEKNIIEKRKKIGLMGRFKGAVGEVCCFAVSSCLSGVTYEGKAEGDIISVSISKKPDLELIKNKLSQLGDTDYTLDDIEICVDENAFIPLSVLKHLKREAIHDFENNVNNSFRRVVMQGAKEGSCKKQNEITDDKKTRNIRVYTETKEQLDVVLEYSFVAGIILDLEFFSSLSDEYLETIEMSGKRIYISLPDIVKNSFDLKKYLPNKHINGIYIRNIDGLSCIHSIDASLLHDIQLICEPGVYAYNKEAVYALTDICPSMTLTLPMELNLKELVNLRGQCNQTPYEMMLYGHTRVMLTAQCVGKTKGHCSGSNNVYKIKDDMGNVFYSYSSCKNCYSRIYNKTPFSLIEKDVEDIAAKLGVSDLRIDFTVEDVETVKNVLDVTYKRLFLQDKNCLLGFDTTTGHLFRGVE